MVVMLMLSFVRLYCILICHLCWNILELTTLQVVCLVGSYNGIIALKITFLGVGHVYEYEMNGIIVLNITLLR